jgi:hypothetical protein
MIFHVLPGDAIAETFRTADINGKIITCRECLVDGDLGGDSLDEFWNTRADFISSTYGGNREEYFDNVAAELTKLRSSNAGDEVNLWFEYELFCQTNYWFVLSLLRGTEADVFRVSPIVRDDADKWKGFGRLSAKDLELCYAARIPLTGWDIEHGSALWQAFRENDADQLRNLTQTESGAFPMLTETIEAAIAKDERPQAILSEIIEEGTQGFDEVFRKFSDRAGVYGYGDTQVKRLLENL